MKKRVVPEPPRLLHPEESSRPFPLLAVWELTMKCDQPCQHCGSRAGPARPKELDTEECFRVVDSLARLRCREVSLIGGEAYLRPDLLEIVRYIVARGIRVTMQTGGRAFTEERASALRAAGLDGLGVSIDGPASVHDRLRGNLGSHAAAMAALRNARKAGLVLSANTQVNHLNWDKLLPFSRELRRAGIQAWQVQLTGPMGRAADHPEWILPPHRIVDVIDTLAEIQREAYAEHDGRGVPFRVQPNNNIGYFGPHEQLLRSRPGGEESYWQGCQAGMFLLGIESDGTLKACPTLPTEPYGAGNVLETTLEELWERAERLRFARDRTVDELWGFCKTCYYADVCKAGCSWTAHTTLGRRGNYPFCYYRVTELRKQGLRERLVPREAAPGRPYDFGRFELELEAWPEGE